MKIRKTSVGLALTFLCAQQLVATVTIQFEFEAFRDSSGDPLISQTYAVLIADSNKDSVFPSASDLFGSGLAVGDDIGGNRVFFAGTTGDGDLNNPNYAIFTGTAASLSGNDLGLNGNDEIAGTKWAVYWFPGLSAAPGTGGLQAGQSYGFYHSDQIDTTAASFGATASMVMPSAGSAVSVLYYDTEIESTSFPSPEAFTANLTVIPEPTAMVLAMFGSTLLLRRQRI